MVVCERQKLRVVAEQAALGEQGVPQLLASRLAALLVLVPGLEIVAAARDAGKPETELAKVFVDIAEYFRLEELKLLSGALGKGDYFERLAVDSTLETVAAFQRDLARRAVLLTNGGPPDFARWRDANADAAARAQHNLSELLDTGDLTLAKLTLAVAHLRDLPAV
jgi:glutamate dehydrogenase